MQASSLPVEVSSKFIDNNEANDVYSTKYDNLLEYYDHIFQMNNRLRHRIYHVKKEINHLKQLKRVLCERLFSHRAVIIDSNLEIPDDSSMSMMDKIIGEVANSEQTQKLDSSVKNGRKRKQQSKAESEEQQLPKNASQNKKRRMKENSKRNIVSIIESIAQETHNDDQIDQTKLKVPNNNCESQIIERQDDTQNANGNFTTGEKPNDEAPVISKENPDGMQNNHNGDSLSSHE